MFGSVRNTTVPRAIRKPWWDQRKDNTSDDREAIRLTAEPKSAQTKPLDTEEIQSFRPWETEHLGTWEYAGPGYGWYRRTKQQTAEQFRNWLDEHPEYVTLAPPARNVSVSRWHVARQQLIAQQRRNLEETFSMSCEDVRWESGQSGERQERMLTEFAPNPYPSSTYVSDGLRLCWICSEARSPV